MKTQHSKCVNYFTTRYLSTSYLELWKNNGNYTFKKGKLNYISRKRLNITALNCSCLFSRILKSARNLYQRIIRTLSQNLKTVYRRMFLYIYINVAYRKLTSTMKVKTFSKLLSHSFQYFCYSYRRNKIY